MSDDSQILISRLLTHQTLRRDDRLVKRALSDELFRAEVDQRLLACGMRLLDNVYADHVTLALTREIEPKVFGAKDVWQNNNFGLARDGVALLVVLWAQIILPKRERQETHQHADDDQNDMFGVDKPLPRAEDTSIGIPYKALLADFGDKLGRKTRMDMNLGILSKLGFIERRGEVIFEGPLLDLVMDTDLLKERIVNGALADVFKRRPTQVVHIPRAALAQASAAVAAEEAVADAVAEVNEVREAAKAAEAAMPAAVAALAAELDAIVGAAPAAGLEPADDVAADVAADVVADVVADVAADVVADVADVAGEPAAISGPVAVAAAASEAAPVGEAEAVADVVPAAAAPEVDAAPPAEPVAATAPAAGVAQDAQAPAADAAPATAPAVMQETQPVAGPAAGEPAAEAPAVAAAPAAEPAPAAKPARAPRAPKASKEQKDDELPPGVDPAWPFEQFKRD